MPSIAELHAISLRGVLLVRHSALDEHLNPVRPRLSHQQLLHFSSELICLLNEQSNLQVSTFRDIN